MRYKMSKACVKRLMTLRMLMLNVKRSSQHAYDADTECQAVSAGQDVVFHVATAQYFGGEGSNSKALMHGVNVIGTQNVIDACVTHNVPRLVYTSSASVVFEGKDLVNVDERTPYAAKPMDYYTGTKASVVATSMITCCTQVPCKVAHGSSQNGSFLLKIQVKGQLCAMLE